MSPTTPYCALCCMPCCNFAPVLYSNEEETKFFEDFSDGDDLQWFKDYVLISSPEYKLFGKNEMFIGEYAGITECVHEVNADISLVLDGTPLKKGAFLGKGAMEKCKCPTLHYEFHEHCDLSEFKGRDRAGLLLHARCFNAASEMFKSDEAVFKAIAPVRYPVFRRQRHVYDQEVKWHRYTRTQLEWDEMKIDRMLLALFNMREVEFKRNHKRIRMSGEETKPEKKIGYAAWDLESTGPFTLFGKDDFFAFGIAHASYNSPTEIRTDRVCLYMGRGTKEGTSELTPWEEHWKRNGFDESTGKFWMNDKNVRVMEELVEKDHLARLESGDMVITHGDFARSINNMLAMAEGLYDEMILVTDCPLYDPMISGLLIKHGYPPLQHYRTLPKDGYNYRSGIDADAYRAGLLKCVPHEDAELNHDARIVSEIIDLQLPELGNTENTHDPREDAKNILVNFFRLMKYAELERK